MIRSVWGGFVSRATVCNRRRWGGHEKRRLETGCRIQSCPTKASNASSPAPRSCYPAVSTSRFRRSFDPLLCGLVGKEREDIGLQVDGNLKCRAVVIELPRTFLSNLDSGFMKGPIRISTERPLTSSRLRSLQYARRWPRLLLLLSFGSALGLGTCGYRWRSFAETCSYRSNKPGQRRRR